jgi:hypothetical protein
VGANAFEMGSLESEVLGNGLVGERVVVGPGYRKATG